LAALATQGRQYKTIKAKSDEEECIMGALLHAKFGPNHLTQVGTEAPNIQNSVNIPVVCPIEATMYTDEAEIWHVTAHHRFTLSS